MAGWLQDRLGTADRPTSAPAPALRPGPAAGDRAYAWFQGTRGVDAPLTWGQRAMWRTVADFGNRHALLNLRRTLTLSRRADATVPMVARALGVLVSRHGALRTRIRRIGAGLWQVPSSEGRLPLVVDTVVDAGVDPDGGRAARVLADRLGDPPFDHEAELPLRAALVVVDGQVRQVVLVFSHSTVDFQAAEILLRDLRTILFRGRPTTRPGLQSVEIAGRERQIERRRSDRAVEYWVRQFQSLTSGTFAQRLPADPLIRRAPADGPGRTGPATAGPYRSGSLVSEAVGTATRLLADRHRVSTSTVLLAATSAVLARDGDEPYLGVVSMASNRYRTEYSNAVATLNQIGLCRLDLTGRPGFAELLPRTWRASLDGYRHAYYDPAAMERAFAELGHDHGTALAPFCYLNDIRLPGEAGRCGDTVPDVPGRDEAVVRAALARSRFTWSQPPARFSWRCRIQVVDAPGAVRLVVTADTRFLSSERAETLLWEIEELLVEAAYRDLAWPWRPRR